MVFTYLDTSIRLSKQKLFAAEIKNYLSWAIVIEYIDNVYKYFLEMGSDLT